MSSPVLKSGANLRRAKSTSSVPRSSSLVDTGIQGSPAQLQSAKLAVQAAHVAFHRYPASKMDTSSSGLERYDSRSSIGNLSILRRSKSQSCRNHSERNGKENMQSMTMGERAERCLRRERSLKRTLRDVEPGRSSGFGVMVENVGNQMVRKVRSMGGHQQHHITPSMDSNNIPGKENRSLNSTSLSQRTPLPPYSSPLISRRQNTQLLAKDPDTGPDISISVNDCQATLTGPPVDTVHSTSTPFGSRTARLRHRASFMLSPLPFRSRKTSLNTLHTATPRKWSAGTGVSTMSGASKRSRTESLRDKLKRYFRKSSTGSGFSSATRDESVIPEQHVEARRKYFTSSNLAERRNSSRLVTPTGPMNDDIGLGIQTIRVKTPGGMSEAGTMQSKSRVTSWADSSIAGTFVGESRNLSRLNMTVEDGITSLGNGNSVEKRVSSIGSSFLKRLMRRSTINQEVSDPASAFEFGTVNQRRNASFVSLASWKNKSTVRSVTPDVGNVIPEEPEIEGLGSGCPPNTPYSVAHQLENNQFSSLEQGKEYHPTEEQLVSRGRKAQNRWQAPLDEHRSLFFPRSPSSPSKSKMGLNPTITPRSSPMRPVTTIVKLSPVVTNLERSFNNLREPESPGSPEKFGAMSPSIYSRATDDEKPIFGATMANILAGWDSPERVQTEMKEDTEGGDWRMWISNEVQELDATENLEDELNVDMAGEGDDTIMRNEVLEGTMLGPPTPEMLKEEETCHKREGAEAEGNENGNEEIPIVRDREISTKNKGKAPITSISGPVRYRLKRNTDNKPARPTRLNMIPTTDMNDRFPMLVTGLRTNIENGSPAKKTQTVTSESSGKVKEKELSTLSAEQLRPSSALGLRAADVSLATPAFASSSRPSLVEVRNPGSSYMRLELNRNMEAKRGAMYGDSLKYQSMATLGGQSVSTYYTARGSPMGSTPASASSAKTAINIKSESSSESANTNINSNHINSFNTHKLTNMQSSDFAFPTPVISMAETKTDTLSPSSSNTLKPLKWQNRRPLVPSGSFHHFSPSLAILESEMQLRDILRGSHTEPFATRPVDDSVSETDKENVNPSRGIRTSNSMNFGEMGSEKRSQDVSSLQGVSPGKRMAERWLSERRSETILGGHTTNAAEKETDKDFA